MIEKNWNTKKYVLWYTVTFLLFAGGAFLTFLYTRRTFICDIDGLPQYYPYMVYMGKAMREFLDNLRHGKVFQEMYDFTIGLGSEASIVFRPHPLDLLSVFVPERYTEWLYQFISLLSMYLSGLSFSAFAFHFRKRFGGLLVGSMVYVFCGFTLRLGLEHPAFLLHMFIFPLMLLTAEWLMEKKGFLAFSLTAALGWASGYYFMYVSTMGLGIYMLLRLPHYWKKEGFTGYLRICLTMMFAYLLGTCMAAVFFLPCVSALSSSGRSGGKVVADSLWVYPLSRYYQAFLYSAVPYLGLSHQTYLNFPVIAVPAIVSLMGRPAAGSERSGKPGRGLLRAALIICFALLLIPFGSYILAGLSYLNGRWIYMLALVVGLICTSEMEKLAQGGGKRALLAALPALLMGLAAAGLYVTGRLGGNGLRYIAAGIAALGAAAAVLALIPRVTWLREHAGLILLAGTFLSVCINGYVTYSNDFAGMANEFLRFGESYRDISESPYTYLSRVMEEEDENLLCRADTDADLIGSGEENYPMVLGYRSTSMYNSFMSSAVLDFFLDQESTGANAVHRLRGFASRTVDEALMNVKYFLTQTGNEAAVPYGYEKMDAFSDESYSVYENTMPLSFGYSYDACLSESEYEGLSGAEKEQALLRAALVDDETAKIWAGEFGIRELPKEEALPAGIEKVTVPLPESTQTVSRAKNGYSVLEKEGTVSFTFERKAGFECYLRLLGFRTGARYIKVRVITSDGSRIVPLRGASMTYALERENYTVRLGYDTEDKEDTLTLMFPNTGYYALSGMELIYVPMESYEAAVEDRNEAALDNVSVGRNAISGEVSAPENRIMVFSIPAGDGWSASLDGEKADLVRVNVGLMGIMVPEGEHTVSLSYMSPGLKAARILSGAGWLIFAAALILRRRARVR